MKIASLPRLASFAMLLSAGSSQMALAQEVHQTPVSSSEETEDARTECLPLRLPGIAEPADHYNAYVRERCGTGLDASAWIRETIPYCPTCVNRKPFAGNH